MDGNVGGWAEDAVLERNARQDLWVLAVPNVDERDRILPRRQEDRLAGVIPQDLLIVAGHQNLRASCHRQREEDRAGEHRDAYVPLLHDFLLLLRCGPTMQPYP